MTDHQRRRAQDHPSTSEPRERDAQSPKRRAQDFLYRIRKPLIGLGIAGASVPLIQTGRPAAGVAGEQQSGEEEEALTPEEVKAQEAGAEAARAPAGAEEALATRIAGARTGSERADTVRMAIERYEIPQDLAEDIYDHASQAGIDPKLAYGLVKTESAFRHQAVSNVGARGLTQVMPRTGAWLRPGTRADDLFDRHLNLDLGFNYLNQLIDKYGGDTGLALLAYNRGPGTVDRILERGGNPDNDYARKVIEGGLR